MCLVYDTLIDAVVFMFLMRTASIFNDSLTYWQDKVLTILNAFKMCQSGNT